MLVTCIVVAILCSLANQKEERAGKYYSVLSASISLKQFEYAKVLILIEKLLVAAVFLAVFAAVSNLISPALAVYSMGRNFAGSVALMVASIWQVPLCLFLARKTGLLVCPYCWAAKTAELLMGIESNGTFAGVAAFSWSVLLPLVFSVILCILLTLWDAVNFSKKEGK